MRLEKILILAVLVVVAAPLALAGAKNGGLTAPGGGPGAKPQGSVKLKYDRTGEVQLFEVQIRKLPTLTYYIFLGADTTPIGQITIATDGSAGKFKLNTSRGDVWSGGDPAGADICVSPSAINEAGTAVLVGTVPDPKVKK